MNKREVGAEKEAQICKLLEKHGYEIVEQNYRVRQGEIDIIAKDGDYLVFVEVKYRSGLESGEAAAAVNFTKQKQISKVAMYYFATHPVTGDQDIRFDVVAVDGTKVKIFKNAFDFIS